MVEASNKDCVVLIGYRATGKSTVARRLAECVNWDWSDSDEQIQQQAGMTIAEIFARHGEEAFRDIESDVVARLAGQHRIVLALGGGAVLRAGNRDVILRNGHIVWLRASPETIHRRITADPRTGSQRPNLTNVGGLEEIRQLLRIRTPIYEQCANATIDTDDKSVDEVVDNLRSLLRFS